MKLLVIGGGGREHALAWKLAQARACRRSSSRRATAAPRARPASRTSRSPSSPTLADVRARASTIHLTVVGPEAPLAAGVVDAFRDARACASSGRRGPRRSSRAPRISPSASWCATASRPRAYETFSDAAAAQALRRRSAARRSWSRPTASPPARAWSSRRARTRRTRRSTRCWPTTGCGDAGARVVIEEFLEGEEASFIVMCDGEHVLPLATSQDHKRLHDGDEGPNTGGMGAYSPAPVVTPEVHARVMREIIVPTVRGHGGGRHAVRGLPLRRPDDRRRRATRRCSNSTAASATRRRSRSCCA